MSDKPVTYQKSKFKMEWDVALCDCCSACVVCCSLKHFSEVHRSKAGIRLDLNYNLGKYTPTFCRQCDAPSCVQACRLGACYVDEATGIRKIDMDECVGCKRCMKSCPFDAIVYLEEEEVCFKCDLCDGESTCRQQCPSRAITITTSKKK